MNLIEGDCLEKLKELADNSVDSLVTDPPAGISFMGKAWDDDKGGRDEWIKWLSEVMRECHRVMKPGAHGLVWSLPRTSHWTAMALELAGFEVRDCVTHLFGQGFPKSLDISKAIDKAAGLERSRVPGGVRSCNTEALGRFAVGEAISSEAISSEAKQWQGWGTALKPAAEFWWLIRKPCSEKTVAANVQKWGTGGINIDASRIAATEVDCKKTNRLNVKDKAYNTGIFNSGVGSDIRKGRFPANLVLSHSPSCTEDACDMFDCAVVALDEQSGISKAKPSKTALKGGSGFGFFDDEKSAATLGIWPADPGGGASRFFYCAKISSGERNAGLDRTELVDITAAWENEVQQAQLQVDTAQSPPRVIVASGTLGLCALEWNTLLFGSNTLERQPKASKSTTKTATRSTIESKTLNWLLHSNTSASTLDANSLVISGGSLVDLAQSSSPSTIITSEKMDIATSAKNALSDAQLTISSAGHLKSTHPTVKPKKLMGYLIKLITPPNGVVLDPFMGSGSTGLACKNLHIRFIGIEKETEYFKIAEQRISNG